jgi:uncharacterized protein with ParB-like and HNH nuclease domain
MAEQNDWDVEPTEERDDDVQDAITFQINFYPADLTLKGYLDKSVSGQLQIPLFQRSFVWDQVKASKLIESFLLGLPVPNVFLYKERETNKLQVIDGQQRILSAVRFFKNEFDEKIFRLKNVNPKWNGKTYQELDEADRYQLDDTVLRATVIQQLDPDDDSSIYHIFERLNTGGINLNPMEIRKCVHSSDYFNLLEELNKLESWRKIIGQIKIHNRLQDVELLLRLLALSDSWEKYKKPMKKFLNKHLISMKKSKDMATLEDIKATFSNTCNYILENLGEKPFHIRGRLNYAAVDSTYVAASIALKAGVTDLEERYKYLLADKDFIELCTKDTSDDKVVTQRIARAIAVLAT